jgi:hypothetical protein
MKRASRSRSRQSKAGIQPQLRAAGYFANIYSRAEIREENRLAKASVIRVPKDLE